MFANRENCAKTRVKAAVAECFDSVKNATAIPLLQDSGTEA
jgi:hypothetical protein